MKSIHEAWRHRRGHRRRPRPHRLLQHPRQWRRAGRRSMPSRRRRGRSRRWSRRRARSTRSSRSTSARTSSARSSTSTSMRATTCEGAEAGRARAAVVSSRSATAMRAELESRRIEVVRAKAALDTAQLAYNRAGKLRAGKASRRRSCTTRRASTSTTPAPAYASASRGSQQGARQHRPGGDRSLVHDHHLADRRQGRAAQRARGRGRDPRHDEQSRLGHRRHRRHVADPRRGRGRGDRGRRHPRRPRRRRCTSTPFPTRSTPAT